MTAAPPPSDRWELAAEAVAVQIRWFGLVVGALLINVGAVPEQRAPLNAILLLGLMFTAIDTAFFTHGRVFLRDFPLVIVAMEALFIGLLCYFEDGLSSPFRFYYLLSLVCCALRYSPRQTALACGLDVLSYSLLYFAQPAERRDTALFLLMLVVLAWVTWAAAALARLIKRGGEDLKQQVAERTRELEETQAQVLHQEKMAAFGLLAAGIAHEVGNPLTAISTVVQLLEGREQDGYNREKLAQVNGQLVRIQSILRELVTFSRPADDRRGPVSLRAVVDESLSLAKYYKGGKNRRITADLPPDLPLLVGVKDQLVQVLFNLLLNAIDATGTGGTITLSTTVEADKLVLAVADNGCGIPPDVMQRLFRPFVTTKRHGTGLGLFVIRRLVEGHGGSVACESAVGVGTTFRIILPLGERPA